MAAPGETTEWEDIQIRMGNMAPRPKNTMTADEYDEMAMNNRDKLEQEQKQKLENASLEDLEELEDMEDEQILEAYRQKRLQQMKEQALKEKYGSLMEINEPEYKEQVTNVNDTFVVVYLYRHSIPNCNLLEQRLIPLAKKFKATKFVKIKAEEAIKNYPDRNLPTLLVYSKGDIVKQIIGLSSLGGDSITVADLEWALKQLGAVDSDMEEPPRKSSINRRPLQIYTRGEE